MKGLEKENDLAYQFNGMIEREKAFGLELYETANRGYDPQIGRFWQVEPLADMFVGINVYQFGYNNPVSFNDPTGLNPSSCAPCSEEPAEDIGLWLWFGLNRGLSAGERGQMAMGGYGGSWARKPVADKMVLLSGMNRRAQNVVQSVGEGGIDLSDLRNGDPVGATRLVRDLKRFTGLASLHINEDGFLDYDRGYWIGRLFGFNKIKNPSAVARRELIRAIKSKTVTKVLNNYNGAHGKTASNPLDTGIGTAAIPNTNIIFFDRWQIEGIQAGASSGMKRLGLQRTWGLATNFFHEYKHTLKGGGLLDNYTPSNPTGDVVAWVNRIRRQMNLPLMQQYVLKKYEKPVEGYPWLDDAFGVLFFDKSALNHFKSNYKFRGNYTFNENLFYFMFPVTFIRGGQ